MSYHNNGKSWIHALSKLPFRRESEREDGKKGESMMKNSWKVWERFACTHPTKLSHRLIFLKANPTNTLFHFPALIIKQAGGGGGGLSLPTSSSGGGGGGGGGNFDIVSEIRYWQWCCWLWWWWDIVETGKRYKVEIGSVGVYESWPCLPNPI